MTRPKNASQMSSGQRMAEVGSLLARGYRRSRLSRSNCLADLAPAERPCKPVVYAPESPQIEEVA